MLERLFHLRDRGTNAGTEIRSGVVSFLTMAYILFVNPQILAASGMPAADVVLATALSAAVATLVMGLSATWRASSTAMGASRATSAPSPPTPSAARSRDEPGR